MDDVKGRWMNKYKDHREDGQMDSTGNRQIMVRKSKERHGEKCEEVRRS